MNTIEQHLSLGINALKNNALKSAEIHFLSIIYENPEHCRGIHYLSYVYAQQKKYDKALQFGYHSLSFGNKDPQLFIDLAYWHNELGEYKKCVDILKNKLPYKTKYINGYRYLSLAYRRLGKYTYALTHSLLGAQLAKQRLDQVCKACKYAFNNFPNKINLLSNQISEWKEWHKLYRHFIYEKGYAEILSGNLINGWQNNEARRINTRYHDILLRIPYWRGQSLKDKTLLILPEQGIGDELIFSSVYPQLIEKAKKCHILCDKRLVPLYKRSFNADIQAYSQNQSLPEDLQSDYIIIGVSACTSLRTTISDFSKKNGWIKYDLSRTDLWKNKLNSSLKVGIAWRSKKNRDEYHSAQEYWNLLEMEPILTLSHIQFVSLQYDDPEEELEIAENKFNIKIYRPTDLDLFNDFDGTASLMKALDLVICPTTSTLALAGACGILAWSPSSPILQFSNCGQLNNPFLPSTESFPALNPGNWDAVMHAIRQRLIDWKEKIDA